MDFDHILYVKYLTTKINLFYSSKAVRLQGGTLIYMLFVYDLLNIGLQSSALMAAIKQF